MTAGSLRVAPLLREHAEDLCTWRYPPPYDCYDMTDADPDDLLNPERGFHAVLDGDRLIGFRSFGADGRVPACSCDPSASSRSRTDNPDAGPDNMWATARRRQRESPS